MNLDDIRSWTPIKMGDTAVDFVVATIRNALQEGKLNPGDRLPSEEELAQGLSVARGTIREATKMLRAYGVLEIQQGRGTFIADPQNTTSNQAIMMSFAMLQPTQAECCEYRELLERAVLISAIQNATDDDIKKLEDNIDTMKRMRDFGETTAKLDCEFHMLLGKIVPNRLIRSSYMSVISFLEPLFMRHHSITNHVEKSLTVHGAIIKAIKEHDVGQIETLVALNDHVWETVPYVR